ncbi:MAG: hypothetical protein OHK0053_06440 [Microscillaceae bacterium]
MESFDVIKILSYGLSGLAFLLIFMTYSLIASEQKRARPRREILGTIRMFMGLVLLCVVVVGVFGLPAIRNNSLLRQDLDTLRLENYRVSTLYQIQQSNNFLEENAGNLAPARVAEIIEKNAQKLDTLSKVVAANHPEEEKVYRSLQQELQTRADTLTQQTRPSSPAEVRRITKEVKKLNRDFEKLIEKRLREQSEAPPVATP